jgi:hypothetical protein
VKLCTNFDRIWDSLSEHLAIENKEFVISVVKKGVRGREFENVLTGIENADLYAKCAEYDYL